MYRKAANRRYADAQSNLGEKYKCGQGVPHDYPQALIWYRKASEQGDPVAQSSLGELYAKGRGVPQDIALAHSGSTWPHRVKKMSHFAKWQSKGAMK